MQFQLAKVPFYYKDAKGNERIGYNLFVVNEDNNIERIECENYPVYKKNDDGSIAVDKSGKKIVSKYISNEKVLCAFAITFQSKDDIVYKK